MSSHPVATTTTTPLRSNPPHDGSNHRAADAAPARAPGRASLFPSLPGSLPLSLALSRSNQPAASPGTIKIRVDRMGLHAPCARPERNSALRSATRAARVGHVGLVRRCWQPFSPRLWPSRRVALVRVARAGVELAAGDSVPIDVHGSERACGGRQERGWGEPGKGDRARGERERREGGRGETLRHQSSTSAPEMAMAQQGAAQQDTAPVCVGAQDMLLMHGVMHAPCGGGAIATLTPRFNTNSQISMHAHDRGRESRPVNVVV